MPAAQRQREWEWDNLVRARMVEVGDRLMREDPAAPMVKIRNVAMAIARQELVAEKVIPGVYRTELLPTVGLPF